MAPAFLLLLLLLSPAAHAGKDSCDGYHRNEQTRIILSPPMTSRPGDVNDKYFYVESPASHFATVDFVAELVYENGEPVPLTDVYLHHWTMYESFKDGDLQEAKKMGHFHYMNPQKSFQAWSQGGETRHMNSTMPSPYGMMSGGDGAKRKWVLNVHGIDTRGALHRMACTECRCDLFTGGNRTDVPENYAGGLKCCRDEARCKLRDDFNGDDKSLEQIYRLKFTWTFVDYDECVVPLSELRLDVTASAEDPLGMLEYTVEGHCNPEDVDKPECVDVREVVVESRLGGDMVYAVSHLHAYSLNSTLYGEDGRVLCHSPPIYGQGTAAGDESGYVVGIRHCNPVFGPNGAGKIKKGEKLRYVVKYSKVDGPHTGVMGNLFIQVAEEPEIITTPVPALHGNRKILN